MAKNSKTITIKCAGCHRKVFKYNKIGKGFLLRCWKKRILIDNSKRNGDKIVCTCGMEIGIDKGNYIKMNRIEEF